MTIVSLIAIYFVVWWIVLFAVLPWGVRTQQDDGAITLGTAASAPTRPRLLRVALITTIVAAIVVGALWIAIDVYGFNLEVLSRWFDFRR